MDDELSDDDILHLAVKLYQYRTVSKVWTITGYKCPYCGHHYYSLRKEMYTHIRNCDGPKIKRSLED